MTRFLGPDDLDGRVTASLALGAMEQAFSLEADARTFLVPRADLRSGNGFLRVMPAVLDDVMGLKVMTLAEGIGTRYVVLLFDGKGGELLAIVDADELTRHRTAATTALAGRMMVSRPPKRMGLVGSGFEAVGELRALAAIWPLDEVLVYSPNERRRVSFSEAMREELGIEVRPVATCHAATVEQEVVVLATKSKDPVLEGDDLAAGCVVLSIGSTRLDLRELDRATLARAGTVVGDDPAQLESESGDIADAIASGALSSGRIVSLSDLCTRRVQLLRDEQHDLLVFKSVGTALQDLAIARVVYDHAVENGYGTELGELASLKPFASDS